MQLRLILRLISRNLEIYFLKIITLSIACAALVMVSTFSLNEFGYDRFHQEAEDIFRVIEKKSTETYGRNKYASKISTEIIEELSKSDEFLLSKTKVLNELNIITSERTWYDQKLHTADENISEVFTFSIIDGSINSFNTTERSVLLSEKSANEYFSTSKASGETLSLYTYNDTIHFRVAAVYETFPINSHQNFEAFFHFNKADLKTLGYDPNVVEVYGKKKVSRFSGWNLLEKAEASYTAQPITEVYFGPRMEGEDVAHGDLYSIIILISIAALILFLALTSFINLTSLALPKRVKEIAVKKLSGHNKLQLTLNFIGESFFIAIISLLLGCLLIWLCQLFVESIKVLDIISLIEAHLGPLILVVVIFLLLLSTTPILMIRKFIRANAIRLLSLEAITFPRFKKVIIIIQLGVSIFLIVSALIINRQVTYSLVKEPGRNNYQVVYLSYPEDMTGDELRRLRNGWRKSKPNIVDIMATSQLPNQIQSKELGSGLYTLAVDAEFDEFFGLELIEGSWFGANDGDSIVVINETARDQLSTLANVRGVFSGLSNQFNQPEKPLKITKATYFNHNFLCIRILEVDILKTVEFLEYYFSNHGQVANIKFLDQRFENWLDYQLRLNSFSIILTIIAAILSCFAIYGLSISVVRDKLKQIAIRKICGADLIHIIYLLIKEFSFNLLVAVLLFAPITYIILKELLRTFAYSTKLNWLDPAYPLGYCIIVIIVLCTWQAFTLNRSDLTSALKE